MTHPRAPLLVPTCLAFLVVATTPARAQTPCPSWSPGLHVAGADGPVRAFAVHDEGVGPRLFAGGEFIAAGDVVVDRIARFDGTVWSAVGGGVDGTVQALLSRAEPGGSVLYAGGAFRHAGGIAANRVARWDGASWSALGAGLPGAVRALCEHDAGSGAGLEIYAGGDFPGAIARWDGAQWTIVGPGLSGGNPNYVATLAVYDDGSGFAPSLYAGGQFRSAGGTFVDNIARWDGNIWISPSSGINGTVRALTVFDEGAGPRLFAGGTFIRAGGVTVANVARWNGTTFSGVGSTPDVASFSVHDDGAGVRLHAVTNQSSAHSLRAWNGTSWSVDGPPLSRVQVVRMFDDGGGARLYAGGEFTPSSTIATFHVARRDASGWAALTPTGQGFGGRVNCMTAHDDGSGPALYVSGAFLSVASAPTPTLILRWNGVAWSGLPGPPDAAYSLASFDDGSGPGLFATKFAPSGSPYRFLITRWNGSTWTDVGGIPAQSQYAFRLTTLDDGSGRSLYAAGSFSSIARPGSAPVSASRVARWDGTNWSGFGSGPATGNVYAVAVYDDGLSAGPALYAGGDSWSSFHGIARWNGTTWVDVGGGVVGTIEDLIVHDDGAGPQLYACGTFAQAGGVPAPNIARWNGTAWSSVGGSVIPSLGVTWTRVNALVTFDEGDGAGTRLFAQGVHAGPSGTTVGAVARWDGSTWSVDGLAITGALAAYVLAPLLATVPGPGGAELWCAGDLRVAGGRASYGIARLLACDSAGSAFCLGDGSATACPCGNSSPPGTISGCVHSHGGAGSLAASGLASVGADSLVLRGSAMTNGACLYFQGTTRTNGGAGVAFGDGLRCAGGAVVRIGIVQNPAGASQYPSATDPRIAQVGVVRAGDLRHYQIWYRDAASYCTSATWNLTNGLSIGWGA